eukprot:9480588-Pyramimonas_sp.AAC.1
MGCGLGPSPAAGRSLHKVSCLARLMSGGLLPRQLRPRNRPRQPGSRQASFCRLGGGRRF